MAKQKGWKALTIEQALRMYEQGFTFLIEDGEITCVRKERN